MTAIIMSRSGWMVADTRRTGDHWLFPCVDNKIIRFGMHSLVAVAGLAGFAYETKELQVYHKRSKAATSAKLIDSLCEMQQKHASGRPETQHRGVMIVTRSAELVMIDCAGMPCLIDPKFNYWAGGSGDELCLGFLAGLKHSIHTDYDITTNDATNAIRYASTLNLGVSYETTMEKL